LISRRNERFQRAFGKLPAKVKLQAKNAYKIWKDNPHYPGLKFSNIHPNKPLYSIRIGLGWRAIGLKEGDCMIWFRIGSHEEYNNLLTRL